MTFSDTVKKEILAQPAKLSRDRRAFGAGLLYAAPAVGGEFVLRLPDEESAALAERLIRERFGESVGARLRGSRRGGGTSLVICRRSSEGGAPDSLRHAGTSAGGRGCAFSVKADSTDVPDNAAGEASAFWEFTDCAENISSPDLEKDRAVAFVRGVFVAAGTVSDPASSSYHAEFILPDAARARAVYTLLAQLGSIPKIINRKNGTGLYFKSSDAIEELLVKLGATGAAFRLINCKIERTLRNNENRATNCVARNISKTVTASRRQVDDIEKLSALGLLEGLPFDLRVTAKLRLENPEASLAELAELHRPTISKSGLNHRLKKISDEADKY